MNRWTVLLAALLIVVMGCSGGGNPTIPTTDLTTDIVGQSAQQQTHLWGYYDVMIDVENQTVEYVVNRSVQFTANVVDFVNGSPANLQFNIISTPVEPTYIGVSIDVGITHPFPGLTEYNGYDVRGVFMGDGSGTLDYSLDCDYAVQGTDQYMFEADGCTRWFNRSEFTTPGVLGYTPGLFASGGFAGTATINPYMYFADGLTTSGDAFDFLAGTDDDGVFAAGHTNRRHYDLRFPTTKGVVFGYAIVANWEDEAIHPSNAPEAVACDMNITDSVWFDPGDDTNGGNLTLEFSIFGWGAQPSAMFINSSVLSDEYELDSGDMTPTGGGDNYSTYEVDVVADHITGNDNQDYWVVCEFDGETYANDLGVTNSAGSDVLAAFFHYELFVAEEAYCTPITITGINPAVVNATTYTGIEITGTGYLGLSGTATTADVEFRYTEGDVVATNVVVVDDFTITCDADFGAWATDGFADVWVRSECLSQATADDMLEFVSCPAQVYYTTFDASEGEATNWTRTSGSYWYCHWFDGAIADTNSSCSLYSVGHLYAYRTMGIEIPACYPDTYVLEISHMSAKQETYYDRGGVQYSLNGSSWSPLMFYDHPYVQSGQWWDGSWSLRTSHANLYTVTNPGDTVWIRFDSYSVDSLYNAGAGWQIQEMTIE